MQPIQKVAKCNLIQPQLGATRTPTQKTPSGDASLHFPEKPAGCAGEQSGSDAPQKWRGREYRAQDYFIGSGVIEAGCKTVSRRRLKPVGMFWSEQSPSGS